MAVLDVNQWSSKFHNHSISIFLYCIFVYKGVHNKSDIVLMIHLNMFTSKEYHKASQHCMKPSARKMKTITRVAHVFFA
jgi:hypothetical protein